MRLTKIKLAGFKSFVDPTQVSFPSNLTGVVGPNGCGKSNVIDAVRWVMGELSAKHLRGDNMADVVFNGSAARKPVGTASVELVFDNSRRQDRRRVRQLQRDCRSSARCRATAPPPTSSTARAAGARTSRNLFLGTGLGSRSYAIIEQGMISRVIEAKTEDMRAFVEEAAGISRYKERRKETESRISETRENLERLQDVRDEIEKQIRHLQRQAATARRYQALKETGAAADRGAARSAHARSGQRRGSSRQRDARARDGDAGGARGSARRRSGHRKAARLPGRAERARRRPCKAGTTRSARISRAWSRPSNTRASCVSGSERIWRRRVATLNDLATHIERDERELASLRERDRAAANPSSSSVQAAESGRRRSARRGRAGAAGLAAALGGVQSRARLRGPDDAGRARAHRAAGESAAAAHGAGGPPRAGARCAGGAGVQRAARLLWRAGSRQARAASEELSKALAAALERVQTLRSEQLIVGEASGDGARGA